jgi:DNA-binding transcriptional ArsR family regulator
LKKFELRKFENSRTRLQSQLDFYRIGKKSEAKMTKNTDIQQPLRDDIALTQVLHALSDPVRMQIVLKIARSGQVACGAFDIPMPKSTLSHHFKVLRESGVVACRREGNELMNSLRFEDLEARFPGVIKAIIAAHHFMPPPGL